MGRLKDTDILGEVYDPIGKEVRENVRLSELRDFLFGVNPPDKKESESKAKANKKIADQAKKQAERDKKEKDLADIEAAEDKRKADKKKDAEMKAAKKRTADDLKPKKAKKKDEK